MKKLYFMIMVLSFLFLADYQTVKAQDTALDARAIVDVSKPQDVGNKICPVSGEKIEEAAKATYVYEGKIYNFCCTMCIDAFKNDPQKYIDKVAEELREEGMEKSATKAMPDSMDTHGSEHH